MPDDPSVLSHRHLRGLDQQAPLCCYSVAKAWPDNNIGQNFINSWWKCNLRDLNHAESERSSIHTHITRLCCELSKACLPVMSSNNRTP